MSILWCFLAFVAISVVVYKDVLLTEAQIEINSLQSQLDIAKLHQEVLSPYEFQEYLNRLEPENSIEVDGRIGTETIKKWERIYCNQSAAKTFIKNN